jgi:hypothetical protein
MKEMEGRKWKVLLEGHSPTRAFASAESIVIIISM